MANKPAIFRICVNSWIVLKCKYLLWVNIAIYINGVISFIWKVNGRQLHQNNTDERWTTKQVLRYHYMLTMCYSCIFAFCKRSAREYFAQLYVTITSEGLQIVDNLSTARHLRTLSIVWSLSSHTEPRFFTFSSEGPHQRLSHFTTSKRYRGYSLTRIPTGPFVKIFMELPKFYEYSLGCGSPNKA